jgi:hypothetical protein
MLRIFEPAAVLSSSVLSDHLHMDDSTDFSLMTRMAARKLIQDLSYGRCLTTELFVFEWMVVWEFTADVHANAMGIRAVVTMDIIEL